MRYFPGLLFLGAGDHSLRLIKLLHARLDEALHISGGLQQSSQGMPEDEAYCARFEAECEDAVRDIAAALLGREVTVGRRLPYPYDDEPTRLYAEKVK
jgi:hypothetical protein